MIGLAGGAPVIIGGGQMLGIHPPGLINVGTVAESYYHALGMVFMGFGVVIVATSLWSCFRSLGGGWKAKIEADVTLASWGTSAWWLKGSSE